MPKRLSRWGLSTRHLGPQRSGRGCLSPRHDGAGARATRRPERVSRRWLRLRNAATRAWARVTLCQSTAATVRGHELQRLSRTATTAEHDGLCARPPLLCRSVCMPGAPSPSWSRGHRHGVAQVRYLGTERCASSASDTHASARVPLVPRHEAHGDRGTTQSWARAQAACRLSTADTCAGVRVTFVLTRTAGPADDCHLRLTLLTLGLSTTATVTSATGAKHN